MRTLVVSDLHLGSRLGHDVLRRTEPTLVRTVAVAEYPIAYADLGSGTP